MPRERFDDCTTTDRYVQVNWRRRDDNSDQADQYVQVSTHSDGETTVSRLLGWAIGIISNVDAPAADWPNQTDEWRTAALDWLKQVTAHGTEVTGEFTQLDAAAIDRLIKALHKSKRQALGDPYRIVGDTPDPPVGPIRVIGDVTGPGDCWVPTGPNGEGHWV